VAGIVELILADHGRIRLMQAELRAAASSSGSEPGLVLSRTWDRLADLIEAHTAAEQEVCWPAVAAAWPQDIAWLREVAADSEDIRTAIGEAALRPAGSPGWWRAVNDALRVCSRSLDREERGLLAGFARHADPVLCDQLGRQWLAFLAARSRDAAGSSALPGPWAAGLPAPGRYPARITRQQAAPDAGGDDLPAAAG
jgi:hypothetical protein